MSPFDRIVVELGPTAYAEPYVGGSFLKMPANALVNVIYPAVGIYWLTRARGCSPSLRPIVRAFGGAAVVYGFVQFTRIVTQTRAAAVLDQWATLPFFALVVGAAMVLRGATTGAVTLLVLASVLSYGAALFHPSGFDVVLGAHIVAAVAACVLTLRMGASLPWLILAVLACSGFVLLKVGDHWLAAHGAIFSRLTGHFWSKICDALQIHFVLCFFVSATAPRDESPAQAAVR